MRITIKRMTLERFKGIERFELDLAGESAAIFGRNAAGKTTCMDAFLWCLFGRDSHGRADFAIKTLTVDGEPLHMLDHSVELVLDVDGDELTLKRTYREIWQKTRGQAKDTFKGHESVFWIDGVPCAKREYEERIASIVDEKVFALLTDPAAFNNLHWQKRREILLAVTGDVTDEQVIASDPALAELPGILGKRKLDDHKKVLSARKTEINKELEGIPKRIDENQRMLPDATQANGAAGLQTRLQALRQARAAKEAERVRITTGGEVAQLQRRITELDTEMLTITQRARAAADQAVQAERRKLNTVNAQADALMREIQNLRAEGNTAERETQALQTKLTAMRAEWAAITAREHTDSTDDRCPTCGQAIPAETVEAAREAALAAFNAQRAADLEANQTEGKRLKGEWDKHQLAQQQHEAAIKVAEPALAALNAQSAGLWARINALQATDDTEAPDVAADPEYVGATIEREQLQEQIAALQAGSGNAEALAKVGAEIAALDQQIAAAEADLGRIAQREAGLRRIAELKAEERRLAAEYEKLEAELFLCEQFTRAKVSMLTDRINSRFTMAKFQLFEEQINGGLTECCNTTHGGVPWSDLNTGARTNVGIDILNVLADHHKFAPPVWCDNSESVTEIIPTRGQMIKLVVQPQSKCRACDHVFPVAAACPDCGGVAEEYRGLRVARQPAHQYEEAI